MCEGILAYVASVIIGLCDSNFTDDVIAVVGQLSMKVESCTLDEFISVMNIETDKHNLIQHLSTLNVAHYVLSSSMIINLIGKNVNATNYSE